MRRPGLLLALLLLPAVTARATPESAPPSVEAIDGAIERGVTWLLKERRPAGTWASGSRAFGHTALALFALLHAGVDEREDEAVARSLAWLDRHGPGRQDGAEPDAATYDTSLALLLLRDRGRAADRPRRERLARVLEASQAENGQWSYAGQPGGRRPGAGDNSNTQFAVLALGAAAGEGVTVEPLVLKRALRWWTLSVQEDGGFGYASGGSRASASTGSMTAAGICSLRILESALGEDAPAEAARVRGAALRRLALEFEVDRNFGPAPGGTKQRQRNAGRGWNHYYLWSVERAMVLAEEEWLGGVDWYAAGARHLLATQKRDGSWRGEHPLYATCFALLFLTRAADPPRAFTPRPGGRGRPRRATRLGRTTTPPRRSMPRAASRRGSARTSLRRRFEGAASRAAPGPSCRSSAPSAHDDPRCGSARAKPCGSCSGTSAWAVRTDTRSLADGSPSGSVATNDTCASRTVVSWRRDGQRVPGCHARRRSTARNSPRRSGSGMAGRMESTSNTRSNAERTHASLTLYGGPPDFPCCQNRPTKRPPGRSARAMAPT